MFEILKGHDSGASFWIQPVKVLKDKCIGNNDVTECPEKEISLDEEDVHDFLCYFFRKHFDKTLVYNCQRKEDCTENAVMKPYFEWYLTHNFYTYETAEKMCRDIEIFADNLERVGLDCIPDGFLKYWLIRFNNNITIENWEQNIDALKPNVIKNIPVVADYCRKVADAIRAMMKNKPDWQLISVMGP